MLCQNSCLPDLQFRRPGLCSPNRRHVVHDGSGAGGSPYDYRVDPPAAVARRGADLNIRFSEEDGIGIVEGRNVTPEELREHLSILPCRSPNFRDEKAALGLDEDGRPTVR